MKAKPTNPSPTPTPTTQPRPKAALYCRVSTKDKGQDVNNQLIPLRAKAKAKGWDIIREYVEHESAAGKVRRAQYAQMLKDADDGLYQTMAFWSLDRFSREGAEQTLRDLRRLTEAGVLWISLQDPIPDEEGPMREMVIAIMASLAALETNRRRERALAAVERKRAAGEAVGSVKMAVDRGRVEELLAQDFPFKAIARDLGISRGTLLNRLDEWGLRNQGGGTQT